MSRTSVAADVTAIQRDSKRLAKEPVPESADYRALNDTTTVALRLSRADAVAISALASAQPSANWSRGFGDCARH